MPCGPKRAALQREICDDEQKKQNTPADGRGNAPAPQGVHDGASDEGGRGAGRQKGQRALLCPVAAQPSV